VSRSNSAEVKLDTKHLSKRESKNARKRRMREEKQGKMTPKKVSFSEPQSLPTP